MLSPEQLQRVALRHWVALKERDVDADTALAAVTHAVIAAAPGIRLEEAQQTVQAIRCRVLIRPLQWSTAFETGIPPIDDDHRTLVALYNDLSHALRSSVSDMAERKMASEVGRFLREHLRREESYLKRLQPFVIAEHLRDHRRCEAALTDLEVRVGNGLKVAVATHMLHDWIIEHVLVSDRVLCTGTAENLGIVGAHAGEPLLNPVSP